MRSWTIFQCCQLCRLQLYFFLGAFHKDYLINNLSLHLLPPCLSRWHHICSCSAHLEPFPSHHTSRSAGPSFLFIFCLFFLSVSTEGAGRVSVLFINKYSVSRRSRYSMHVYWMNYREWKTLGSFWFSRSRVGGESVCLPSSLPAQLALYGTADPWLMRGLEALACKRKICV